MFNRSRKQGANGKIYYVLAFGDFNKLLFMSPDKNDLVKYIDKFEHHPLISYLSDELGYKTKKFREPTFFQFLLVILFTPLYRLKKLVSVSHLNVLFSHVYSKIPAELYLKGTNTVYMLDDLSRWRNFESDSSCISSVLRNIWGLDYVQYNLNDYFLRGISLTKLNARSYFKEREDSALVKHYVDACLLFISSGETNEKVILKVKNLANKLNLEYVFRPHPRLDRNRDVITSDIRTYLPLSLLSPNGIVIGFGSYALVEAAESGWIVYNVREFCFGKDFEFYQDYIESFNTTVISVDTINEIC